MVALGHAIFTQRRDNEFNGPSLKVAPLTSTHWKEFSYMATLKRKSSLEIKCSWAALTPSSVTEIEWILVGSQQSRPLFFYSDGVKSSLNGSHSTRNLTFLALVKDTIIFYIIFILILTH